MAGETYIPSKGAKIDVRRIFREIRDRVENATSRKELTELYKYAGYMITMTHATPINEKSGGTVKIERGITEREFARTARKINHRAKKMAPSPITMRPERIWQAMAMKQKTRTCLNSRVMRDK